MTTTKIENRYQQARARVCPYCQRQTLRPIGNTNGEPSGLVRRRCDSCGVVMVDIESPAQTGRQR